MRDLLRIAGTLDRMPALPQRPAQRQICWPPCGEELRDFFRRTRILTLCSTCFEGFPTVIAEAMLRGKSVICSRIGDLPEIVDDGQTGLLFHPGNAADLARTLGVLWESPQRCRALGQAGRAKAQDQFSSTRYYERLMGVYFRALKLGPGGMKLSPRRYSSRSDEAEIVR